MIRTAFLVGASVIAAVFTASCMKTQPPQPVAPVEHRAQICHDADTFAASVHILTPGYDPTTFKEPTVTGYPLPPVVTDDLRSAYNSAPDFFRKAVCELDGVFIDQTYCDNASQNPAKTCFEFSWGFRSHNESNKGKRYVAISLNLWSAGNGPRTTDSRDGPRMTDVRHAPKLTDYSTRQLNTLLTQLNHLRLNTPPSFDSKFGRGDPADTPAMTVLTVLAHEVGHVRWYDWSKPYPGINEAYDFSRLINCNSDGSFFKDSWSSTATDNQAFAAPHWLTFGEPADPGLISHKFGPPISEFITPGQLNPDRDQLQTENYQPRRERAQPLAALAQSLNVVYSDQSPWPSLLGFLSPTEDLVETYVLTVQTRASPPLRSLRLNIPRPDGQVVQDRRGVQADIVAQLSDKPALARKIACVSQLTKDVP